MRPLKSKSIITQVADTTGFSIPVVDAVVNFFYSNLKKNMSQTSDITLNAPGLGSFRLNKNRVLRKIDKLEKSRESFKGISEKNPDSDKLHNIVKDRSTRINDLSKTIQLFEDEEKKKKEIKEMRNQISN